MTSEKAPASSDYRSTGIGPGSRAAKRRRARTVQAVVDYQVCCGCGACAAICPVRCIELIYGRRYNYVKVDMQRCADCGRCLRVCPSEFLLHGTDPGFVDGPQGAAIACYLVRAQDPEIRHNGASGGGITSLLDHLMSKGEIDGAIVAETAPDNPFVSKTLIARDRDVLLVAQGSRYTPVSNCMALHEVLETPGRYAVVGTPCMIQATARAQEMFGVLQERIVLKIGLVCSGMAPRSSTSAYLLRYGVDLQEVRAIHYRGDGWPGSFRAWGTNGILLKRPYLGDEERYLVARDRCLRCWNCLDHWAAFADIAVSDPWCKEMVENEHEGWSAMMVRTERGAMGVKSALESGWIIAESISTETMLGYNARLVINREHSRHAWMASYQLVFLRRLKYLPAVIMGLLRRKPTGLVTTLKARLAGSAYQSPGHVKMRPRETTSLPPSRGENYGGVFTGVRHILQRAPGAYRLARFAERLLLGRRK